MPFTLYGPQGPLTLTVAEWGYALQLAEEGGWEPEGTQPPHLYCDDERACVEGWCASAQSWEGHYNSNDFQTVSAEDAAALADALAQILPQLAEEDLLAEWRMPVPGLPGYSMFPGKEAISAHEWFSGGRRDVLQAVIEHCRQGSFYLG